MKLINFLYKIYCIFFGYRITGLVRKFTKINKKYWDTVSFRGDPKNGYALINGTKNSASYIVVAGRAAKAIEEKTGCPPNVLINAFSFSSKYFRKIYGSYGIKNFIYFRNYSFNPFILLKALFLTLKFFYQQKSINDLLYLKFDNFYIGDLIYDTILRFRKGLYTINEVRLAYFGEIYSAFLYSLIYKKIFQKYDIKYVYSMAIFINGGTLARCADKNGATVLLASSKLMKNYKGLDIREGKYRPRLSDVNALRKMRDLERDVENYLNRRFSGSVNEIDVLKSYKGKNEYDKDLLCNKLKLDKSKPIVFIMPHAFSDGPHHTPTEKLLFRDFYTWLVETIKCVSKINNANWVIKPHPMAFKYEEEGEVKKLVDLYGRGNISISPEDLNTKSIKDIADVIMTVQGKSGLEFGCFGIPTIITSYASYGGFGFTVEPKSVEEYFKLLKNVGSIPKLNAEQIKTAKVLSAIMFIYSRTSDPLFPPNEDILYFRYNDNARWKQSARLMKKYDRFQDQFYQRIKDLLDLNLYRKYLDEKQNK